MRELFHVSGAGNDFLAFPGQVLDADDEGLIRAWCTRGLSLGADGVFTLERGEASVRMDYWNSDGRPADLCLNGTRCAARLAFHLGWAAEEVVITTAAGDLLCRPTGPTTVAVEIPRLTTRGFASALREATFEVEGRLWEGFFALVGVPHFVLAVDSVVGLAVEQLAPPLRRHPVFGPAGANVDFLHVVDSHNIEVRTFERGVEGETLACGTGVLAAVATGLTIRQLELPVTARTLGGFELTVDGQGEANPLPERWLLAGEARILAHARLTEEAGALPVRPAW
ncbi:MAG TPA: diaminopimelate epimerase [Thermoanaerobaculia bacterium]|nr:diaminopimelate epimerase [Thermoanaerobaculia bacterium]